jgi:thioredoxin-related protein
MHRLHVSRRRFAAVALMFCLPLPARAAGERHPLPLDFDPTRDPARDLEAALRIAGAAERRVVLDVGGEWCSWCRIMDRFFAANPELKRYRDAHFVWLKVNWSPENRNEAFLRAFPAIKGYPHLFVLDAGGRLLHSQDTSELEARRDYNPAAMREFLVRWAPG